MDILTEPQIKEPQTIEPCDEFPTVCYFIN